MSSCNAAQGTDAAHHYERSVVAQNGALIEVLVCSVCGCIGQFGPEVVTPTPAPAPMTAERLAELRHDFDRWPYSTMNRTECAQLLAHIDALTARVAELEARHVLTEQLSDAFKAEVAKVAALKSELAAARKVEDGGSKSTRDPEPEVQADRFVHHYTNRMRHSTDGQARKLCSVLLEDAQWMADERRRLTARVAELEQRARSAEDRMRLYREQSITANGLVGRLEAELAAARKIEDKEVSEFIDWLRLEQNEPGISAGLAWRYERTQQLLSALSAALKEAERELQSLQETTGGILTRAALIARADAAEARAQSAEAQLKEVRALALEEAARRVETIVVSGPEDDEIDHDDYRDMQIADAIRALKDTSHD